MISCYLSMSHCKAFCRLNKHFKLAAVILFTTVKTEVSTVCFKSVCSSIIWAGRKDVSIRFIKLYVEYGLIIPFYSRSSNKEQIMHM